MLKLLLFYMVSLVSQKDCCQEFFGGQNLFPFLIQNLFPFLIQLSPYLSECVGLFVRDLSL